MIGGPTRAPFRFDDLDTRTQWLTRLTQVPDAGPFSGARVSDDFGLLEAFWTVCFSPAGTRRQSTVG